MYHRVPAVVNFKQMLVTGHETRILFLFDLRFSRYMEPLVQHLLKEASGERGFGDRFSRSKPVLAELQGAPILEQLRAYNLRSELFRANTRAHESDIEESVF